MKQNLKIMNITYDMLNDLQVFFILLPEMKLKELCIYNLFR